MTSFVGKNISLRALEPSDLDFLFCAENDESFWEISGTQLPYSKFILNKYIENAHQDIYEAKQYRFVICNSIDEPVGMIDLFEFDPHHKRVGIGILILPKYQRQQFALEALDLVINYSFNYLNVHQIFANILSNNAKSIALFEKFNFKQCGIKKDWIFSNNSYKDEILYQLIKN